MTVPNIFADRPTTALPYRTAETGQQPINLYKTPGAGYELVYTVPAGKTFYISNIVCSNSSESLCKLATGEIASEVDIFVITVGAGAVSGNANIALYAPIQLTAGTKLSFSGNSAEINVIGWIE